MYSIEIFKKGIEFLEITDLEILKSILKSNQENLEYLHEENIKKLALEKYNNRFKIPQGLTKQEYKELLKETQNKIDILKEEWRRVGRENGIFLDIEKEDYIAKKLKLKKILELHNNFGTVSIDKAKQYPIEDLIEFYKNGFASCPFHGPENTPSFKLYKERNKGHCFSCGIDADSIDIFMKINNVTFIDAVKKLS